MPRLVACAIAFLLGSAAASAAAVTASFTPLGDLGGEDDRSVARDVSADGKVVVGESFSMSGQEAFRWTADGGMVGLGDLSGGAFVSRAFAASADGSVIVGHGQSDLGTAAVCWTNHSMTVLDGLSITNFFSQAEAVSSDGRVVAGYSRNDSGDLEALYWSAAEPGTPCEFDSMMEIGDLPGGAFFSESRGVYWNGSTLSTLVIVGFSNTAIGQPTTDR